jgi:hypothetical protein
MYGTNTVAYTPSVPSIRSPPTHSPIVDCMRVDQLFSFVSLIKLFKRCLQQRHCGLDWFVEDRSSSERSCCLACINNCYATSDLLSDT